MTNYLLLKHQKTILRRSFFILFIITLFLPFNKSFSEENIFTINDVIIKGEIDLNFSREKYINKAFINSFDMLMNKILISSDLPKINSINIKKVKNLIESFQILEEKYSEYEYEANFKIFYSNDKTKKFLREKNISFSQPEYISAVFFPVIFINDEIKNLNENFFYKNWKEVKIKNELINFILPLDDLDDISELIKMKNRIEEIDVATLVDKYDVKNYVFALMEYQNEKLNIHVKTNFNNNKISKNFSYKIKNINDEIALNSILVDLKIKITDLWKKENLINLLMPLSITLQYEHNNLKDLDELRNIFYNIDIIDDYTLEEFNINNSLFKIYYYGNPKKLKTELIKFGYHLKNDQGYWRLNLHE